MWESCSCGKPIKRPKPKEKERENPCDPWRCIKRKEVIVCMRRLFVVHRFVAYICSFARKKKERKKEKGIIIRVTICIMWRCSVYSYVRVCACLCVCADAALCLMPKRLQKRRYENSIGKTQMYFPPLNSLRCAPRCRQRRMSCPAARESNAGSVGGGGALRKKGKRSPIKSKR